MYEEHGIQRWSDDQIFLAKQAPIRLIGEKEQAYCDVFKLSSEIFPEAVEYAATVRFVAIAWSIDKKCTVTLILDHMKGYTFGTSDFAAIRNLKTGAKAALS